VSSGEQRLDAATATEVEHAGNRPARGCGGQGQRGRTDPEDLLRVHAGRGPARVVRHRDIGTAVQDRLQPHQRRAISGQPRRR